MKALVTGGTGFVAHASYDFLTNQPYSREIQNVLPKK